MYHKRQLDKKQINQLKRIILFDIWIGNKDRHTANILVVNDELVAFDHDRILQKGRARSFIKIDTGRKLNKDYIEIIEMLLDRDLTAKQALKKIGFEEKDFIRIQEENIRKLVKDRKIINFLVSRTDLNRIQF